MQNDKLLLPKLKMLMLAKYLSKLRRYFSSFTTYKNPVITFSSKFKIQKLKEEPLPSNSNNIK